MQGTTLTETRNLSSYLPDFPLVIWMVLVTVVLGLGGGMTTRDLVGTFNTGFGSALGEFALILLPSFVLAAVMSRRQITPVKGIAVASSPFAGAGMICPDTAYAALSPIAGRRKLDVAFGAYAGFKLVYPAGPLIVATGLGVYDPTILVYGLALIGPVWLAGVMWVKRAGYVPIEGKDVKDGGLTFRSLRLFAPFSVLAVLLVSGALVDLGATWPILDFVTQPKGALLVAAAWALWSCPSDQRKACLDSSISRTSALLLVIGVASAFGAMLTKLVPLGSLFPAGQGVLGIVGLFAIAALFKLA